MSETRFMPLQSAPIDRTPAGAAAFADSAGVEAAGWFDDIVGTIGKYAPTVLGALGSAGI
jgi:hypothetical protein